MKRLEEHEILHLIDCVKLGINQNQALRTLIEHCKDALKGMYYLWQFELQAISNNSEFAVESVFGRAVYQACLTYDEVRGAAFHSYAYLHIRTAVRMDIDLLFHKRSGITRMRDCPEIAPDIENDSWSSDEYSCADQCGWNKKEKDKNVLRPCKSHYSPPKPKPNLDLAVFYESNPKKHVDAGSDYHTSTITHLETNDSSPDVSSQKLFIESLDAIRKKSNGKKGPDPGEHYMFEFLQQTFNLNPTEDESIAGLESTDEDVITRRLDLLPPWMREIISDLLLGLKRDGVFNVEAVAEKHGITQSEVLEIVIACIQRLRRLDQVQ